MYIIQYKKLKFNDSFMNYYSIDSNIEIPLFFIYFFFNEGFKYIKRQGISEFLKEVDINEQEDQYVYELVSLSTDYKNKLLYLHEPEFDYCRRAETAELAKLLDELTPLQACQQNLIDYAFLTQENFNQIIIHWDESWKTKELKPLLLLYLDDKNWYDVLPFENQEAMEQFVADHTKKE